ncbi:SDR family oxidoreductase [Mesorhizobium sp. LHD-90]|uniref:SDR family NAD(P)-dependent oxidoreductase n=1 Tax=Mesorhizobium sp. LHD-90 TaxID=3071414 RepID=UPI0027E1B979|nr:SDR family oxidoreductase [Mesorhizobium sp. LHD-90]MDQ6433623.1 SDR family oxidoreductase [Mesorhizobium sp. LHD-90]
MNSDTFKPAIVITGASAGIGRAMALSERRERGVAVLVARSPSELNAVANEIRQAGGDALTFELDLLSADAPARLSDFLSGHGLACDVLVNSAGYGLRGKTAALPIEDQLGIVDVNIRALAALTLHFLPGMVARGRGGVINLGSVAGFLPGPYMSAYYASKAFVRSFSNALHEELRHEGVTVTCVAPGPVRTKFLEKAGARRAALFRFLPKTDADFVADRAWRGFRLKRRLVVPGMSAKLTVLAASLVPSAVMLPLVGRLQRKRK